MIEIKDILDVVNTLGITGVLIAFVMMFTRGEIMSRKVYMEMTERHAEIMAAKILEGVREIVRTEINDK